MTSSTSMPQIALLAATETSPSVLYGLYDVLRTAGAAYSEMTSGAAANPLLDVKIVAADATPFRCYGNVLVEPACSTAELDHVDAVVVCDMYQPIDQPPRGRYAAEIGWLKKMHEGGALITSVCTGSLLLAESGLLEGLEMGGHWAYRDMMRQHYPRVRMREDAVLCRAGESNRIVTAGGSNSWQELALYLIMHFLGREQALQTVKIFLFGDLSSGQLPFAVMTPRRQSVDAVIADCQVWIAENYACANPVARMMVHTGLKLRTFGRRFRAATGYEPMTYVHAIRIEEAKQMLEIGADSVESIAHAVGYEDPTSFRRLFKRNAGLTPAAYRRKFARLITSAAQ